MNSFEFDPASFDYYFDSGWLRPSAVIPVRDGYLFGFDMGEWGGSLWWRDISGNEHTVVAKQLNVKALLKSSKGDVIVIDGIAHMGLNQGTVTRLSRHADSWNKLGEVQLGGEPQGWFQAGTNTLVVSAGSTVQWVDEEALAVSSVVHVPELDLAFQWVDAIAPSGSDGVLMAFAYYVLSVERDGTVLWHASREQGDAVCCHCTPLQPGGT